MPLIHANLIKAEIWDGDEDGYGVEDSHDFIWPPVVFTTRDWVTQKQNLYSGTTEVTFADDMSLKG